MEGDDVGEHHGGQHPLGLGNMPDAGQELLNQVESQLRRIPDNRHISPGKFDELRAGDLLGQEVGVLDRGDMEAPSVEDQRWHLDQRQQRAQVALQDSAQRCLSGPRADAGAQHLRKPAAEPLVTGSAGHIHRGHGVGAPQLVDLSHERLDSLAGDPNRVVVAGEVLGGGVHQDERAGAFWSGGSEEDRGRGGVDLGQNGGPFRAHRVQDHSQLFNMGFPWRQRIRGRRVRGTRAAPVEQDQPRKRRKRAEKQGNPRILPSDIDGDSAGHDQIRWPLAERLVGDPVLT